VETRKSILLVTVDCLRADHVGFMGYPRPTTPFLDSLSQESFLFPKAIVVGAPTYYSLPGILASRYPLALGRDVLGLAPGEETLASALAAVGYKTAGFSAANPYISSRFGYAQGMAEFHEFLNDDTASGTVPEPQLTNGGWASRLNRRLQAARNRLGPLGVVYDELYFRYCQRVSPSASSLDALRRFPAADEIVDHACRWLSSVGESPFFLWLHFMDPHSPYYPKDEALALMNDKQLPPNRARYLNSYWNRSDVGPRRLGSCRDQIVKLYDAGVRWVDVQVARLVSALRKMGLWNNCMFALTADHGEEFLDHGGRFHPPSRLAEELIHVPLLLRVPRTTKKEVSKDPFSLLHLAPTLLDAAESPIPSQFLGVSHWPGLKHGASSSSTAISECIAGCTNPFRPENRLGPRILSVRESRFKLILYFDPPADYLYDLDADPGEQAPLAPHAQKPVRNRLLEVARNHLQHSISQRDEHMRLGARLRDLRLEWLGSFPHRPEA